MGTFAHVPKLSARAEMRRRNCTRATQATVRPVENDDDADWRAFRLFLAGIAVFAALAVIGLAVAIAKVAEWL